MNADQQVYGEGGDAVKSGIKVICDPLGLAMSLDYSLFTDMLA